MIATLALLAAATGTAWALATPLNALAAHHPSAGRSRTYRAIRSTGIAALMATAIAASVLAALIAVDTTIGLPAP